MTTEPKFFATRAEWHEWLVANFETAKEVWFVFPNKCSGKTGILYDDAVEEARISAEELEKRLRNFIAKTRVGKMVAGYGGTDKYY